MSTHSPRRDAGSSQLTDRVRVILAEAARFDGTPPMSDQALMAVAQGRRELVDFGDGVGIIGEGELDLVVRPQARGQGIGRTSLQALLGREPRRSEQGTASHVEPEQSHRRDFREPDPGVSDESGSELKAWAHGENPAAEALLRGAGFAPVRTLLRMALDPALLPGAIASARPLPDGFEISPFDPTQPEQADEWVRVNAAAFASHPEQGAMTRADFDALTREPWFAAEDLRLAFDVSHGEASTRSNRAGFAWKRTRRVPSGIPVAPLLQYGEQNSALPQAPLSGFTWVKTTREHVEVETELYVLGVDPAQAGRGLGAALLGETLRRMARHDPDRITLYVDLDNKNAVALYERAGFEVEQRSTQFALEWRH